MQIEFTVGGLGDLRASWDENTRHAELTFVDGHKMGWLIWQGEFAETPTASDFLRAYYISKAEQKELETVLKAGCFVGDHAVFAAIFNTLANSEPDTELLSAAGKAPNVEWMSQFLMEISPLSGKINWKRYAVELAELLGPDHIKGLCRFFAFLAKVDDF